MFASVCSNDYVHKEHLANGSIQGKYAWAICIVDAFWLLLVWSFVGGAITRIAVVQIGREERIGLKEAFCFVRDKFVSYLMSPLAFHTLGRGGFKTGCAIRSRCLRRVSSYRWVSRTSLAPRLDKILRTGPAARWGVGQVLLPRAPAVPQAAREDR